MPVLDKRHASNSAFKFAPSIPQKLINRICRKVYARGSDMEQLVLQLQANYRSSLKETEVRTERREGVVNKLRPSA